MSDVPKASRSLAIGTLPFRGPGDTMKVTVGGRDILIIRRGDVYHALRNVCAHQHISRLHEGTLEECTIECPMHGWRYDIRTGKSLTGEGALATYPVTVANGTLFIELPEDG